MLLSVTDVIVVIIIVVVCVSIAREAKIQREPPFCLGTVCDYEPQIEELSTEVAAAAEERKSTSSQERNRKS